MTQTPEEKLEDKYSFAEWLASEQGESVGWCEDFISDLAASGKHKGDCTKESQPCSLCLLELLLEDYRKYVFPEATAELQKENERLREGINKIIETRIKELNQADAEFCKLRWDNSKTRMERGLYREESNKVTFARQELESLQQRIKQEYGK
jgi:hypothetical protein